MMLKGKLIGWIVIFATVSGCLLWYQFVYTTPVGLMPLVGCIFGVILGFLLALGNRGRPKEVEA